MLNFYRRPIIAFLVIQSAYEDSEGARVQNVSTWPLAFYPAEPWMPEDVTLQKGESITHIIPAPVGTAEVFGDRGDGTMVSLGYDGPGYQCAPEEWEAIRRAKVEEHNERGLCNRKNTL